jgi:hypothetical protein
MVLSLKTAMYRFSLYVLVSVTASFAVMADPVPVDPQILIDAGGDAPLINGPTTVSLVNGGGIFAFENGSADPLSEIDLFLTVPLSPLPNGFTVDGTIGVPASGRQLSTFSVTPFSGLDCTFAASSTDSCVELKFILKPGPLVGPSPATFVLDFNDMANYNADDVAVEDGTFTGDYAPGGGGSWGAATAMIDPIPAVPEPSYRATAGFMGLALLAAWNYRRRLSAKKS